MTNTLIIVGKVCLPTAKHRNACNKYIESAKPGETSAVTCVQESDRWCKCYAER